ncbi:MAG: class I SAM-dependent methyltransferase [Gloeomargarita sp. SKYBB_i_bin120]|nr:class I SAM-dependent methyltransferase [Gloeomargarita sp. SKYG98]MCS7291466.1 class I SAM-dependent methyltransferase [Gloeomargarita sp. SKYB120]MDW8177026.1 class I SAM-dependent methyltransferase [Gloeomargarita sp. SKYBB_i_bin120]
MAAYWWGNAAKSWILQDLLARLGNQRPCVIFDYGCGDGGHWPHVLRDYPQIQWWGFEPHPQRRRQAEKRLAGLPARLVGWAELEQIHLQADFIVSFSVLEHVYDRRRYLQMAKRQLAPHGIFYLNYDDGHFRPHLEVQRLETWLPACRVALHNGLAPLLARLGYVAPFQQRVVQAEIDALLQELGWHIQTVFYSNLECLKRLDKTLPAAQKDQFMALWLDLEKRLNQEFRHAGPPIYGDNCNLWRVMPSRTLVLTHSPEPVTSSYGNGTLTG